jgi:transposase
MRFYPPSAVERAMKMQEVILRAMSGEITWIQAADILGMTARNLRRLRERYEGHGYDGLLDRRTGRPSPRRVSIEEVERILRLYRDRYMGFNVRHFHQKARREHGITLSYTFVKKALQEAGLVRKGRKRGPHRRRREPRACFGELLHLDGSKHAWLALVPEKRQTLISSVDDATSRLLYSQLWPEETTAAVMTALWKVVEEYGICMSLYTDRANWAFNTPKGGGKVNKDKPTQVGRALARLGIEHIPSYSAPARGRSERLNRTLQDRLINEIRAAGIRTVKKANRYIREVFIPEHNELFSREPRDPQSVFVSAKGVDLDLVLCIEHQRMVSKDNTVVLDGVRMQLEKQRGRATCAGLRVTVRRHLDGRHTVWTGVRLMGTYNAAGRLIDTKKRKVEETPLRATPYAPFPQPLSR